MSKQSYIIPWLLIATFVATSISQRANADDFNFKLGDIADVNPVSSFYEQEEQYREFKRDCLMRGYDEKVAASEAFVAGCEAIIKDETEGVDKLAEFARLKESCMARFNEVDAQYKESIAAWLEEYKERRAQEYRNYEYHMTAYILVKSPRPLAEQLGDEPAKSENESAERPNTLETTAEPLAEGAVEAEKVADVHKLALDRDSGLLYVSGSVGDAAKMRLRGNLKKRSKFVVAEINDEAETGVAFEIEMNEAKKGKKRSHIALDPVAVFKYSDEYIDARVAEEIEKLK